HQCDREVRCIAAFDDIHADCAVIPECIARLCLRTFGDPTISETNQENIQARLVSEFPTSGPGPLYLKRPTRGRCWPHQVEVVAERKNSAVALLRSAGKRFLSPP